MLTFIVILIYVYVNFHSHPKLTNYYFKGAYSILVNTPKIILDLLCEYIQSQLLHSVQLDTFPN